MRRVFHLMAASAWADEERRRPRPPVAGDQLERHGFVHCCTREQIVEIANWWLLGDAPLVVLELDAGALADLRFERSEGDPRAYPHAYGPLPREAVVAVHPLVQGEDGRVAALSAPLADPPPAFEIEGLLGGRSVTARWQDGRLLDGTDGEVAARVHDLVERGAHVPQFLHVTATASLATPYDACCVIAAAVDEVTTYRGDGFAEAEGGS